MSALFDHCQTQTDVWLAVYDLTCWCHPAQGGDAREYAIICEAAKARLGDAWPWPDDTLPPVFDVYCVSKGIPNPFGQSIQHLGPADDDSPVVEAYDASVDLASVSPRCGRILYVSYGALFDGVHDVVFQRTQEVHN